MKKNQQIETKGSNIPKNTQIEPNKNILDIINKYNILYINSKKAANLSKNTINNANIILERFYQYCAEESSENEYLSITDLTKYFLNNYLNKLTQDGLSKNTQKLHLTVIKDFLSFIADSDLDQFGFLKLNLSAIKVKTEQKEKVAFNHNEQELILNYIAKLDKEKSYLAQRNSLLIKILMYTGARISEIINIKWADIAEHYDDTYGYVYTILLYGKGSKERFTYILQSEIQDNLEKVKQKAGNSSYLFTSTQGNQCNRSVVLGVVANLLAKAGVNKTGLHIFRHTFARNLVNKDINLSTIKDLLGHSNISVTAQFYAKSNENAKRNALFKS
ncbi:MAG: tyrosine-type recombinase/integrase [Burkholderiales bacterium]|nr:tyrosine-type recombinase/integrase [Burkholderiales bacterium]